MGRKSLKWIFFIVLLFIIVVAGDDETRDALKRQLKKWREKCAINTKKKVADDLANED